ncbi:hypothetical protein [Massilia luteola]|uniref:hypothetical protein n=1 Tax=Massilia luteola TaxID=3081751 RepID=UPI002ACBE49B|nr:hypothetical protein [Massilia sp. Gc5]
MEDIERFIHGFARFHRQFTSEHAVRAGLRAGGPEPGPATGRRDAGRRAVRSGAHPVQPSSAAT